MLSVPRFLHASAFSLTSYSTRVEKHRWTWVILFTVRRLLHCVGLLRASHEYSVFMDARNGFTLIVYSLLFLCLLYFTGNSCSPSLLLHSQLDNELAYIKLHMSLRVFGIISDSYKHIFTVFQFLFKRVAIQTQHLYSKIVLNNKHQLFVILQREK